MYGALQNLYMPQGAKSRQKDGRQSRRHKSVTLSVGTFRTLSLQVEEGHSKKKKTLMGLRQKHTSDKDLNLIERKDISPSY